MDTIYPVISCMEENLPFFVTGVGCQKNQDYISRPFGFMDYQWAYCRHGKGIFESGGSERVITAKSSFFFRAGVPHRYYPIEEPWEICWITFKGNAVSSLMDYLEVKEWEIISLPNIEYLDSVMDGIIKLLKNGKRSSVRECSVILYSFLFKMKAYMDAEKAVSYPDSSKVPEAVLSYMEKNYSSDISLHEMAEVISVSDSHLCRIFKKHYNMSAITYLTHLRIQKSKELLILYPEMEVKDIARKTGFHGPSYFCHIFRKVEGVTPSEFRGMKG